MACAGPIIGAAESAMDQLVAFIEGKKPWSADIPDILAREGVYSCMHRKDALRLEAWIRDLDQKTYEEEVADMHGEEAVDYHNAMKRDIMIVLGSTNIHGMDLCCARGRESTTPEV